MQELTFGQSSSLTIQNNTVTNNLYGGISVGNSPSATVNFNNIQNNGQYSISLKQANNLDATNNWWGTTDSSAISQIINDYYKDFTLGKVNFVPFLNAPSAVAPTIDYSPTAGSTLSPLAAPSTSPSASSTSTSPLSSPTPVTPEFPSIALIALLLLAATVPTVLFAKKRAV